MRCSIVQEFVGGLSPCVGVSYELFFFVMFLYGVSQGKMISI